MTRNSSITGQLLARPVPGVGVKRRFRAVRFPTVTHVPDRVRAGTGHPCRPSVQFRVLLDVVDRISLQVALEPSSTYPLLLLSEHGQQVLGCHGSLSLSDVVLTDAASQLLNLSDGESVPFVLLNELNLGEASVQASGLTDGVHLQVLMAVVLSEAADQALEAMTGTYVPRLVPVSLNEGAGQSTLLSMGEHKPMVMLTEQAGAAVGLVDGVFVPVEVEVALNDTAEQTVLSAEGLYDSTSYTPVAYGDDFETYPDGAPPGFLSDGTGFSGSWLGDWIMT